jgi:hypothetical protein
MIYLYYLFAPHSTRTPTPSIFFLNQFSFAGDPGYESRCQRWTPAEILVDNVTCATIGNYPNNYDIPGHIAITCSSVMTGRVVRFHKTGGDCCLNLCEFQIYGNSLSFAKIFIIQPNMCDIIWVFQSALVKTNRQ